MSVTNKFIRSPRTLWKLVDELSDRASRSMLIFRGHEDSSWKLRSGLTRRIAHGEERPWEHAKAEALENKLLEAYSYHALRLGRELPADHWTAIALTQHHGLPTLLLDWSLSPYVALFFALGGFTGIQAAPFVSLYALSIPALRALEFPDGDRDVPLELAPKGIACLHVLNPSRHQNQRMIAQEGVFTRPSRIQDDVEQHARELASKYKGKFGKEPLPCLTHLKIHGKLRSQALVRLADMGITPVTMLQDLSGAALSAIQQVFSEHLDSDRQTTWSFRALMRHSAHGSSNDLPHGSAGSSTPRTNHEDGQVT